MDIKSIAKHFHPGEGFVKAKLITNGIINNTYKVTYLDNGKEINYTIQKINKNVFKQPDKVMDNIVGISKHIVNKKKLNGDKIERNVLEYMLTENNTAYYIDADGEYWRCYRFIDNSVTYNNPDDLKIIEQAGKAFGQFQSLLSDYDVSSLHESIPDFHNTKVRFDALNESIELDVADRVKNALPEIEYIRSRKNTAIILCDSIEKGYLPIKVTHNDTKCNNVLFDKDTNEALAVIDLDTVMPGLVAYDYGDAIRCLAATCEEDEKDLSKVDIDMDKIKAFTKGFVTEVGKTLSHNEIVSLSLGVVVITLELASRFLKDYLDGDTYFKIDYNDHNLVRAKCQIELAKKFEQRFLEIKQIVESFA